MYPHATQRHILSAMSTATELGLVVDDAIVLNDSNRLVIRLMPCDTVARVTPMTHFASAEQEVELVRQLEKTGSPVGPLEPRVAPRVFVRDGLQIALWTYCEPVASRTLPPDEYALALARLHAGLRRTEVTVPHVLDRLAATQRDVADHDITPDLTQTDRSLLAGSLRKLERRSDEQLLHGEPHPANVLDTTKGPLFIDFENAALGPVEYDLAWVPRAVARQYPDADQDLVGVCRAIVLAIVAVHRWSVGDRHPSGRESGVAFLRALREGPPWPALDEVVW